VIFPLSDAVAITENDSVSSITSHIVFFIFLRVFFFTPPKIQNNMEKQKSQYSELSKAFISFNTL
jgi:hypothetical protein